MKLFTPFTIGKLEIKNRIAMAPMSLGYELRDGGVTPAQKAFYLRRAAGGVGLIITDAVTVDPHVPYLGNTLFFGNNLDSFKALTSEVHQYGAKIFPQITHPGPESVSCFFGVPPMAPSVYKNSFYQDTREVKLEEIPGLIEAYANSAFLAKMVGFDGIELHAAHAYMLLGAFLSPLRNHREDAYGGSLENRSRLLLEVIDAIKAKCGKDFPLLLRISGSERLPGGNTLEEVKSLVPTLIAHGVDAFEISGGAQYELPNKIIPCDGEKEGLNLDEATEIKKVSSVPVICVGKNRNPEKIKDIIESGKVDALSIGRALLADPDFVNKIKENKEDDISLCASCGVGCVGEQQKRKRGTCVINPYCGYELELINEPTKTKKNILVIGGGVGGMAAAYTLASRGHHVTLVEASDHLGGQIVMASHVPMKENLGVWITYLTHQLKKYHVNVILNEKITKESLVNYPYDELVIATGAEAKKVEGYLTAHDILRGEKEIKEGKVLVVGGGPVGIETIDYIEAHKSGNVDISLLELTDKIGNGLIPNNLFPAFARLKMDQVKVYKQAQLTLNGNHAVINENTDLGDFDYVVYAIGSSSNTSLAGIKNAHYIGDCQQVGQAIDAIRAGTELGLNL